MYIRTPPGCQLCWPFPIFNHRINPILSSTSKHYHREPHQHPSFLSYSCRRSYNYPLHCFSNGINPTMLLLAGVSNYLTELKETPFKHSKSRAFFPEAANTYGMFRGFVEKSFIFLETKEKISTYYSSQIKCKHCPRLIMSKWKKIGLFFKG